MRAQASSLAVFTSRAFVVVVIHINHKFTRLTLLLSLTTGGLDEALNNIIVIAQEQTVPVVFALGRRALGRACAKLVPVSVVGIFNYEGCEVMCVTSHESSRRTCCLLCFDFCLSETFAAEK